MLNLTKRAALAAAFALLALPAFAAPGPVYVKLTTPKGVIVLELEADKAPVTTANFLKYVDQKRYDGATFYRASKPKGYVANDYGTLQGGLQNDPKKVLPPIAHESTAKTGLKNVDGTLTMARHAPGTAQADWFICVGDMSYLDASAKDPGFAAFGHVVEGMDVVHEILGEPINPRLGEGVMKGEMLAHPVPITSARRMAKPPVHPVEKDLMVAPAPGTAAAPAATAPAAPVAPTPPTTPAQ